MEEIQFAKCKCRVIPGEFDIENIPLDCDATWKLISGGHTVGIFQIEKKLGQDWARKVRPNNIEELAALVSLLRPGPLESLMSQQYVDVKSGKKQIEYLHESLAPILDTTYGCLVYQEQALKIAVDIAGFNPEQADSLRKSIGKKLPKLMAELKQKFVAGAKKKGLVDAKVAEEIFGWIEKCQRYSFNKCVSSDTIIRKAMRGRFLKTSGYTVEHMYHTRHDIQYAKKHGHEQLRRKWMRLGHYGFALSMCDDGRIRKNIIRDIQSSGVRNIIQITLEDGSSIKITANHKFPMPDGNIKTAGQLNVGDLLCVCGKYEKSDFKKINSFSGKTQNSKGKKYCGQGFPGGKDNPSYIDGGYSAFQYFKNNTPNVCGWCSTKKGRIESHHKDGDRSNNNWDNLIKLCVSCHKKVEYGNGRTKVLEKGYPSLSARIVDIKQLPAEMTWDITMDGPSHNFVTSDNIITCNSHAASYAQIGYQTAWMKCHFPHEFFTSWLTHSHYKTNPKEEIYNLVQDARFFNIPILSPDIRRCNVHFKMLEKPEKSVAFGLAHIRNVGQSAIKKIVESASGSLNTWHDFLTSVPDFHRNVGIALIKAGACDCYGLSRSQMIHELEVILGTTIIDDEGNKKEIKGLTKREREWLFEQCSDTQDMANILSDMSQDPQKKPLRLSQMKKPQLVELGCSLSETMPEKASVEISKLTKPKLIDLITGYGYQDPDTQIVSITEKRRTILAEKAILIAKQLEDTNTSKAMAEKHFLGIALSCSPADDAETDLATHTCLDVARAFNQESITVCAIVDHVTHTKTKRGKNPGQSMCFLTISDSTYSTDAVVFPKAYAKNKAFCNKDSIVLIYGKKQNRSFIVSEIQKLI